MVVLVAMTGLSMNAKSWTPPTYESLSEEPVSGGVYQLYNVGAGKLLTEGKAWFDWSTTAILADVGSYFIFTGDGYSFTLNTVRDGNNMFFTSGNDIAGDAMHVDGWEGCTSYGLSLMSNGYYHIHDADGDGDSPCWGYNSDFHATGIVAHADATAEGWMCDWLFLSSYAIELYDLRVELYNLLVKADAEGINTDAASTVYEDATATSENIINACKALNSARLVKFMEGKTASPENPIEITEYALINPDFEIRTPNGQMPPGWTITITGQNCGQQNRTDKNPSTNFEITNFIEAWHPGALGPGVIAQTVSSLPEGTYILECDASVCHDDPNWDDSGLGYSDGADIVGANLFIKSSLKTEKKTLGNRRLDIQHYSVSFAHGGTGEVQFGLMATEDINANWLSADNFKIFYAGGVDLSVFVQALAEAVQAFNALESSVDATLYATLKTQVNAVNKSYSSSSEYQAAIDLVRAINDYAPAYTAAITAINDNTYINITGQERTYLSTAISDTPEYTPESLINKTDALNNATGLFTNFEVKRNYDLYVSELAVANATSSDITTTVPTTSDKALEAFQDLNVKLYNYVENRDNYPCSLTSKIGEFSTWTRTGTVDGVEDNKYTANTDQHWSGERRPYYEQPDNGWSHDSWTSHYTKSYKLPAGSYVLKVAARASESPKTSAKITCTATTMNMPIPNLGGIGYGIKTNGNASFNNDIANEKYANNNNGYGWVWNYLPFTLGEETEVTMTIEAEGNGHHEWFSVCDAELLSTTDIATDVTYDETANNTIEDVDVANVTINRTTKDGFNTIVFPFDLTARQVIDVFGFYSKVYTYSEDSEDANNVTIKFSSLKDGTISANVPVLVNVTYPHQIMINGVHVVAPTSDVKVEGNFFDFVGTYAPINPIPAGDYFVGYNTEKPDGAIFKSEGATSINAFRAYIHAKTAGARVTNLYIDGVETTDIDVLEAVGISNGKIYNLNGQEVKKAQKGIYIVNGKKLLVK